MAVSILHILVVDDDLSVCDALAFALRASYVVHEAASGKEACAILRTHPIAGIILDAVLDGEDGLDLVKSFRTLSPAKILLLTGHSTEDLAIRAVRAHVDEYLKKPPSLPELRVTLRHLIPQMDLGADLAARVSQYLDECFAEPLRTADLAQQFGVSEIHLRRCFRIAYGKTPRRYLTELRMEHAARLLCTTALLVEEVAGQVGYPSSTTFGRVFRQLFGVNASEYRTKPGSPTGG